SLVYEHPADRTAVFFLFGRVDAVRLDVHRKSVHTVLNREVFEFAEMIRVVLLNDKNRAALARHINSFQPGVECHVVGALRHWNVGNGAMPVEIEYGQEVVAAAWQKCATARGI